MEGVVSFLVCLTVLLSSSLAKASYDSRPREWCGWEARKLVSRDPGPAYNLAINWVHWGHPVAGPAPGVIGVMPHHVFKVISVVNAHAVVAISGNDGGAVRIRQRSTSGVIAWRAE